MKIPRRGYTFVDGSDGNGHLDAGLFFLAFMRDPQSQFVPMQRALANHDRMMQYLEHSGFRGVRLPAGHGRG